MFNLSWSWLRLVGIHDAPTGHVLECAFDVTGPKTQPSERANTPFSEHVSGEEACSLVALATIISPFSYFQSPFPMLARTQLYPIKYPEPLAFWEVDLRFGLLSVVWLPWNNTPFLCCRPWRVSICLAASWGNTWLGGTCLSLGSLGPSSWALVLLYSRNHRASTGRVMSPFCIE